MSETTHDLTQRAEVRQRRANAPKLACHWCQHTHSLVRDSRTGIFKIIVDGREGYRRIRKCAQCGQHYSTTEHVDPVQDKRINRNRNI